MLYRPRFSVFLATILFAGAGLGSSARAEDYAFTTFAGTGAPGSADGAAGTYNNPYSVAIDAAKNIYVADSGNNTIRMITPGRVVSTLAGSAGLTGSTNGSGAAARFNFPVGLAVDQAGNVYVADAGNYEIRKIAPGGVVTTYAGTPFGIGSLDGPASSAQFNLPSGLAIDSSGNLYVADTGNHVIRKITSAGTVSTLAGTAGQTGFINGTGSAARFNRPFGLAIDSGGNVFVADSINNAIRKITPGGVVTTVAGTAGSGGSNDDPPARFNEPRAVAVDASGNVFVADYVNSVIRQITPSGVVSTIAGTAGIYGRVDSTGATVRFNEVNGILVDGNALYVADTANHSVRRGVPASTASLPTIIAQPLNQVVNAGQSVPFSVTASGSGLTYQWLKNGIFIPGATNASYVITSPQLSDEGVYSVRISSPGGTIDSGPGTLTTVAAGSGPITARPLSQAVSVGQSVTFSVTASGSGLTYQWSKNGTPIAGATNASFTIASAQTSDVANYTVRVTVAGGASETATASLTVGSTTAAELPNITSSPASQTVTAGQSVSFTVAATGTGLTYQWLKDGVAIGGATSPTYAIAAAQTTDAGSYTVRVTAAAGSVNSSPATLTVTSGGLTGPTAWLSNLSVRAAMAAGQTLSVGVFVDGGDRNILVRAAGPALAAFGLPTAMVDPRLEGFRGTTSDFTNDDWPAALGSTFTSVSAFPFPLGSKDAAFVRPINGLYSVQAKGTGPGVVLVEAYDLGAGNFPRLINVSALNQVGTGADILIAGFAINGTGTRKLLIRGVGPRLADFGETGVLADPKIEVYDFPGVKLNENDNWDASLAATFAAVGAFALTPGSKDAALLITLPAGATYSVQLKGADGGTGRAIIEVYEVP